MSAKMTVGPEEKGREATLEDLEEGECSDEDEPPPPPPPVVEEPPKQELQEKEKKRDREERKERKHKRRSRSGSRERHKSKKHKRKKGKEKDKEKIEEDEDDETAKKNAMLRKLKMLEGEMGLAESEGTEEQSSGASRSPSPGGGPGRKRKRDEWGPAAAEFGRKKWKGPQRRICNLYIQGKCPRDESECLFSHDVDVPKVWELCKFYVYDRCVKRDKCLYLHKEFPCKYFHTGVGCMEEGDTCKFSHEPLNDTTRNLLLKHVEAAPKELLGDFPRMTRTEAWEAVSTTEAKNNGWTLPGNNTRRPNSRWDIGPQQQQMYQSDFHGGQQPNDFMMGGMNNQGMFPQQEFKPWGIPKGNKAKTAAASSSPSNNSSPKPADLMEIKLNENAIKKFLTSQQKESKDSENEHEHKEEDDDPWRRGDGDETPEVTPPVSPSTYQEEEKEVDDTPNMPKEHLALYNRIKQKQKDMPPEDGYVLSKDKSDIKENDKSDNVLNRSMTDNASPDRPNRWSFDRQDSRNNGFQASPELTKVSSPSQPIFSKKGEKKDPRLHKMDPRKERQARKEEEERLEREQDERILSLDLDSVLNDLDLPPLTLSSPKYDDDNKYLSDNMGLPFKPHIYHVAKEIDASLNSHPVLDWVLHPVDVPVRDYSSLKFNFSAAQQELDPRLRKTPKSSLAVMKELPLPEFTSPKSDPRLKGRPDPRKQSSQNNQQKPSLQRRPSEDTEGNHVYNPARELSKEKLPVPPPLPPLPRRNSVENPNHSHYEPQYDNHQGGDNDFGHPPQFNQGNDQDQYYPEEYPPPYDQDYNSQPPLPPQPGNLNPMNIQQMQQFSMGLLQDMKQNIEAFVSQQQQQRPNFPGRDPRARPGMNQQLEPRGGFNAPNFPGRMRGFGPPRGPFNQGGLGRPDFRGPRQDFRMPVGNQNNISKRDPRVK